MIGNFDFFSLDQQHNDLVMPLDDSLFAKEPTSLEPTGTGSLKEAIAAHSKQDVAHYFAAGISLPKMEEERNALLNDCILAFSSLDIQEILQGASVHAQDLFFVCKFLLSNQHDVAGAQLLQRIHEECPLWFSPKIRTELFTEAVKSKCIATESVFLAEAHIGDLIETLLNAHMLFCPQEFLQNTSFMQRFHQSTSEELFSPIVDAWPNHRPETGEFILFCINAEEDDAALELLRDTLGLSDTQYTAFFLAAMRNKLPRVVEELYKKNIDINCVDTEHEDRTPLMYAAFQGRKNYIIPFIERGALLGATDAWGRISALDMILEWQRKGSDLDEETLLAAWKLENALTWRHLIFLITSERVAHASAMIDTIIEKIRQQVDIVWWRDKKKINEVFFVAVESKEEELAQKLLPYVGVSAAIGENLQTPLMKCAEAKNENLITQILAQGASLIAKDKNGRTAFQYIMRNVPQFFSIQYLETWPLGNSETDFLLHELLNYNKKECFLLLLTRLESLSDAQVPAWYASKVTKNQLFEHCCRENIEVPVSLFQKIDPNFVVALDKNKTPLMYAVGYEAGKEIVTELVTKKADLEAQDSAGKSALQYIQDAYGIVFARQLLKQEALEVEKKVEKKKSTGVSKAATQKLFDLVNQNKAKELETRIENKDNEFDFTLQDGSQEGRTLLMNAAMKKMAGVVSALIERGANLFDTDAQGKSAIDYIEEFLGKNTVEDIATHWQCSREETKDFIIYLLENEYDKAAKSMTTSKRLWLGNPGSRKRKRNDTATWTQAVFAKIFMLAADRDIRKLAERMITHIDINYVDEDGMTPLLAVARQAWGMLFRRLVSDGADFSARDNEDTGIADYMVESLERGSTLFSDCIISFWPLEKKESVEFISSLLQAPGEKRKRRMKRLSQEEKAEKLIKRLLDEKISTKEWPQTGKTALFELALQKQKSAMALALASGVDVEVTAGKKSFIEIAISANMKDVTEALIGNGASLVSQDTKKKIMFLQLQETFGKKEVLQMLQKVPVDGTHTEELFSYCVRKGLKDEIAVLIQNLKNGKKRPAFCAVAATELYFDSLEKKDYAIAQSLVELVDSTRLRKGHNAFSAACTVKNEAIVVRLLQEKYSMLDICERKKVYELLEASFGLAKSEQFLEQSIHHQIIQRQFFDFAVAQNRSYAVLLKKSLTQMPLSEKPQWWINDFRALFSKALVNKEVQHAVEYISQFPMDMPGAKGLQPLEEAIQCACKKGALQLLLQGAHLTSSQGDLTKASKTKIDLYARLEGTFGKSFFTELHQSLVAQKEYNKVQIVLLNFIAEKKEQFVVSVLQELLALPKAPCSEADKIELFSAAVKLKLEEITLLLLPHIDPNSLTLDKQHLLVQAARHKAITTMKALIYRGAKFVSSMERYDIPILISTVLSEAELRGAFSTLDFTRPEIEGVVLDLFDGMDAYSLDQAARSKRCALLSILIEQIKKLPAQQKPNWWVKDARIIYDMLRIWSKKFYGQKNEVTVLPKLMLGEFNCLAEEMSYNDMGCARLPQDLRDSLVCYSIGAVLDSSFSDEEFSYFLKAGVRIGLEHKRVGFGYDYLQEEKRQSLHFSGVSNQSTLAWLMSSYSDSEFALKLRALSLESPELAVILQTLIENNYTECFLELFTRIQETKNHPLLGLFGDKSLFLSNKNKFLGILFKAFHVKNERLIRLLLPYVDVKVHSMENNGRTVLMEAVRAKVDPAIIYELFGKGASLFQCDNQYRFAFDYLIRETEIHSPMLSNALFALNVLSIMHDAAITNKELLVYFQKGHQCSDEVSLVDKIGAALLVGERELVASYFRSLASVSGKLEMIAELCKKFGEELREPLVNAAFAVDMSHCRVAANDSDIPQKNSQVLITELSELYRKYVDALDSANLKSLGGFEEKVLTKKAYLATPAPNTQALIDFYTTIDNAACAVIATVKQKIFVLETTYQKELLVLEKEGLKEATELLDLIRTTLHEFVEASYACGTRIYSNAIDQYYLIVKEKKRDLKEHIHSELVTRRQSLAMTICGEQGNDVHTYGYFMKLFGERFGLRGYQAFLNYEDRTFTFATHSQQLFDAADKFETTYAKPYELINFVRADLKSGDKKNLFIDYLLANHPKSWDIKASNKLIEKVTALWQRASSVQERNATITEFLATEAIITVDENDLVSLAALQREIEAQVKAGRLYVARSQETENNESNFTFDTIIEALVTLGILK